MSGIGGVENGEAGHQSTIGYTIEGRIVKRAEDSTASGASRHFAIHDVEKCSDRHDPARGHDVTACVHCARSDSDQSPDGGYRVRAYSIPRQQANRRLDDAKRSIFYVIGGSWHSAGAGGKHELADVPVHRLAAQKKKPP